jgi:hypothetical protein
MRGALGLFCNPKNRDTMMAMEKNSVVAAIKPMSEDSKGNNGEKSQLSLELSLSYEAAKTSDHEISYSSYESNEKEPILFIFWLLWRIMISKKEKKIKGNKAIDTYI